MKSVRRLIVTSRRLAAAFAYAMTRHLPKTGM